MNARQSAQVWRSLQAAGFNAVARRVDDGHVVEIEPHPPITTENFKYLLGVAGAQKLELSYGTSPRRVLVLS